MSSSGWLPWVLMKLEGHLDKTARAGRWRGRRTLADAFSQNATKEQGDESSGSRGKLQVRRLCLEQPFWFCVVEMVEGSWKQSNLGPAMTLGLMSAFDDDGALIYYTIHLPISSGESISSSAIGVSNRSLSKARTLGSYL
jgi:hypothetical protein